MLKFETFLGKIKQNKKNHDNGFHNTIPFYDSPQLNFFIPGILQGKYYLISGLGNAGKSKFLRGKIMDSIFHFMNKNPKRKVDVYYNSLEESEDEFFASIIAKRLHIKHCYTGLDIKQLLSIGDYTIDNNTVKIIEQETEFVNKIANRINFINIANVDDLNEFLIEEALKSGKITDDVYIQDDPYHFKILITDHIALHTGRGNPKDTINAMSREFGIPLMKIFNYTLIMLQQQGLSPRNSKNPYDLEPREAYLGEHKLTFQDCHFFIGIFNPSQYEIDKYMKYEVAKFGSNFRSLVISKNRMNRIITRVPFYLEPGLEMWTEIPPIDNVIQILSFQNKMGLSIIETKETVSNYYEPNENKPLSIYLTDEEMDIEPEELPPF